MKMLLPSGRWIANGNKIYLFTEVGVTPHNIRQGHNAPSVENAYQSVIQDLVS